MQSLQNGRRLVVALLLEYALFSQAMPHYSENTGIKQSSASHHIEGNGRLIDLRNYDTSINRPHDDAHRQRYGGGQHNTNAADATDDDASRLIVHAAGNAECRRTHGLEPVADDCAAFLNCVNGDGVRQRCGPGTHFNAELSVCDWPYNVDCGSRRLVLSGGSYALDVRMDLDEDQRTAVNANDRIVGAASSSVVAVPVGVLNRGLLPPKRPEEEIFTRRESNNLQAAYQQQSASSGSAAAAAAVVRQPVLGLMPPMEDDGPEQRTGARSISASQRTAEDDFAQRSAAATGSQLSLDLQAPQASPCGNMYPVIDGNSHRMRCVEQYGTGPAQQLLHQQQQQPLETQRHRDELEQYRLQQQQRQHQQSAQSSSQLMSSIDTALRSNPCSGTLKPVIDTLANRIRCVAQPSVAFTPIVSSSQNHYSHQQPLASHQRPNPCVSNGERPEYDPLSNRVRCFAHGISTASSIYRTVANPCGHLQRIAAYDPVNNAISCEQQPSDVEVVRAEVGSDNDSQRHLPPTTADQRRSGTNSVTIFYAREPLMTTRTTADVQEPARGLQPPKYAGAPQTRHREVETADANDTDVQEEGQITLAVEYGDVSTTNRQRHGESSRNIPFIDADDNDAGQRTQRVEYDFAAAAASATAAPATSSFNRQQSSSRRQFETRSFNTYDAANDEDNEPQQTLQVTYNPSWKAQTSQAADQRRSFQSSSSSSNSSSSSVTNQPAASASSTSTRQRHWNDEASQYDNSNSIINPQQQQQLQPPFATSDIVEQSALDESLSILNSYSNIRRQGAREHVMPIYDRDAMRSIATAANQQTTNSFNHNYAAAQASAQELNSTTLADGARMLMKPYLRGIQLNVTESRPQIHIQHDADRFDDDRLVELYDVRSGFGDNQGPNHEQAPASANQSQRQRGDQPDDNSAEATTSTTTTTTTTTTATPTTVAPGAAARRPILCPQDYWLCETSAECLPVSFLCDGTRDCTDSTDEAPERCASNGTLQWRLADGADAHEGRVEVRRHGVWGTVCGDRFGHREAAVVCRALGMSGRATVIPTHDPNAVRSDPIWFDETRCTGAEASLAECQHNTFGAHDCEHSADVSVRCVTATSTTGASLDETTATRWSTATHGTGSGGSGVKTRGHRSHASVNNV